MSKQKEGVFKIELSLSIRKDMVLDRSICNKTYISIYKICPMNGKQFYPSFDSSLTASWGEPEKITFRQYLIAIIIDPKQGLPYQFSAWGLSTFFANKLKNVDYLMKWRPNEDLMRPKYIQNEDFQN